MLDAPKITIPAAWAGPAPTQPSEVGRRLLELRSDLVRRVNDGKLCPMMGQAIVAHLDKVAERGVAELMLQGDDVFGRLQAAAAAAEVCTPLEGMDYDDEVKAFVEECRAAA